MEWNGMEWKGMEDDGDGDGNGGCDTHAYKYPQMCLFIFVVRQAARHGRNPSTVGPTHTNTCSVAVY